MKKVYGLMILGLMVILMLGAVSASIEISDCIGLQNMQSNLAGDYYLTNDIDCSDTINWNSGTGFMPISDFTGTFDGQNHIITGFFINRPSNHRTALFGTNYNTIENVGLVDVSITGNIYVGGLVGNNRGTITNCYVTGSMTGDGFLGGLVGYNTYGTIIHSYATGSVNGNSVGIGGLVGTNQNGIISNSYSTGSVSGSHYTGGFVGYYYGGEITDCYSTGSVSGIPGSLSVGGLIGYIDGSGTITNSYWDIDTSGQSGSAGGEGKTTTEMKQQSTFVDWDFISIWSIDEGTSYPYFYSGQSPIVPEFGAVVGVLTALGALGVFFLVRRK